MPAIYNLQLSSIIDKAKHSDLSAPFGGGTKSFASPPSEGQIVPWNMPSLCRWLERDKVSLGAYFPSGWDLVVCGVIKNRYHNLKTASHSGRNKVDVVALCDVYFLRLLNS